MTEALVILVIVAVAATFTARSIYKTIFKKNDVCGCVDLCPISRKCNPESTACVVDAQQKEEYTDG